MPGLRLLAYTHVVAPAPLTTNVRRDNGMSAFIKSPVVFALAFNLALAIAGLWSQWYGAWYERAHGRGAWHFGLVEFLIITFVMFGGAGVIAYSATAGRASRLFLGVATITLWLTCVYGGFYLWLNICGS
jgi:hypothetical protein